MTHPENQNKNITLALIKDSPQASAKAKGERLRRLRHLANLTREEFCHDGEVNTTTLISWEVGRFGGLSVKGAHRVISRVAKEGVFCTLDWLLYDVGAGPEVRVDYKKDKHTDLGEQELPVDFDESSVIAQELMLFRKLNKNSIDYIIDDDAMLPFYKIGDYVAGTRRIGDKIKQLIDLDCIIQTKDGRLVMRRLQAGPRDNTYNLLAINLQARTAGAIIYDVEILAAAPVVWHRRKESTLQ